MLVTEFQACVPRVMAGRGLVRWRRQSRAEMGRTKEDWLRDLASGDSERDAALAELRDALLRGLKRALGDRAHADDAFLEDMTQDALVRILDRLPQFEGRSRFSTWATAIAIRVAMSELRRKRWKDVSLDALMSDGSLSPSSDSQREESIERRELLDKLHEIIRGVLSDKQRTALLAELKGMPQDEIARQLGSNRNAVYKLTHDARKRLKRGLEAAGYGAADIHTALAT